MPHALDNLESDSSCLEFFGLSRPPFARLSAPSDVFHTEQYSLLAAHLSCATEQPDCLVVLCGADGSGKTTLLNTYLLGLGEDASFAVIDENCGGSGQFYCDFLRQLGFGDITGTLRELQSITKEFLIHRGMAGDSVLLIVDNAHLINPAVLEQLRWLSAAKVDDHRVLSIVLAGNSDLTRIMNSPAMKQVRFRSHVQFHIRAYSADEVASYIRHRLSIAGAVDAVKLSDDALPLIYRYTGGVPSLINTLCSALLSEAHNQKSRVISDELVRAVADQLRLLPHVIPLQGKGRRKTDPDFEATQIANESKAATGWTMISEQQEVAPEVDISDSSITDLLGQITRLSVELGELRADRKRNLQDISTKEARTDELNSKLGTKNAECDKLRSIASASTGEVKNLKKALFDREKEMQSVEKTTAKLTGELEKESNRKKAAQSDLNKAKSRAKKLTQEKTELRAEIRGLKADLKHANQQASKLESLEHDVADLRQKLVAAEARLESHADTVTLTKEEEQRYLSSESPGNDKRSKKPVNVFKVRRDGNAEQVIGVEKGRSRLMIGRSEDSDLRLNSKFVSRHHALILCSSGGQCIEDLNSSNGTIVNDEKVIRCELQRGDVITIGDFEIEAE